MLGRYRTEDERRFADRKETPIPRSETRRPLRVQVASELMAVLRDAVGIVERAGVDYVLMGGIPLAAYLDRRATKDIDIFVRPEHAVTVLELFAEEGYRTEKTYPEWLFKAFKHDELVDIIFKSRPNIRLDAEMVERAAPAEMDGVTMRLASVEDLLVMQAAAHGAESPNYWFNAIELLQRHSIDWAYLERRARVSPARVLSLLLYAMSNGLAVRFDTVRDLFTQLSGD